MNKKNILVTGSAGFIGMHLVLDLVRDGHTVFGIDSINLYYDVNLKLDRLKNCGINPEGLREYMYYRSNKYENYIFNKCDVTNKKALKLFFNENKIDTIVHLAAQAGVRYSIENPETYITNNLIGFYNIIDCAVENKIDHFIYASSSSVYGNSEDVPFNEKQSVNAPVSLYAATKLCNEVIAHSYSQIYQLKTTGLRFFTVYGPWGRPDMAYFSFTRKILNNDPIDIFNNGRLLRDFTNIRDIVEGIKLIMINTLSHNEVYNIYNIGAGDPIELMCFVHELENVIGKKASIFFKEMQLGDVFSTYADITKILQIGYMPKVKLSEGLREFYQWYNLYHKNN